MISLGYAASAGVAIAQTAATGSGQAFPTRTIRAIVPYAPGGSTDVVMRILAPRMSEMLGQQVIVENRPGGSSTIGLDIAAKAQPDGHTIGIANVTFCANPSLIRKMPFDSEKDLAPVSFMSLVTLVLSVHPSVPAKSVKELVALARAKPGKLDYGSSGVGGFGHISGALFGLMTKTEMVHIPYKSSAPSLTDLIAGQIQVLFNNAIATVPFVKSGQTRALAVTSLKRMAALPDLPTIDESGVKGYDNSSWSAVAAPAGTPKEIVAKLNNELNAILKLPDVMEKNASFGADPVGGTPEQFGDYLKSEIAKFARVVKEAKISAQ